jgi:O-antigen/teichoic acid export membrane protein
MSRAASSLFSHSIAYFAVRAAGGVLALASLAVLVRMLPPQDYGAYALAAAVCNSGAALLFQWVGVGVNRFHAAYAPAALWRTARRLYLGLVVVVAAVVGVAMALPLPGSPALTAAIGLALLGMALFNLHLQIGNARGEPWRYGALSLLRGAFALAAAAALIAAGLGPLGAVLGLAVGAFAAVAIAGARAPAAPPDAPAEAAIRHRLAVYGLPLALASAATMVIDVSDRFLIGALRGTAEVAPYAAAYDLTQQTLGMLLNVVFLAGYPAVTRAWERGGAPAARAALEPMARALLLAAPLLLLLATAFAPAVSRLMFGATLATDSARVMPWVGLAVCLACWRSYVLDVAFQLAGQTRRVLAITLGMAVVNVALNLWLIPRHGAVGAAIAAAAAFGCGAVASAWFARALGVLPRLAGTLPALALCTGLAALPWALGLTQDAGPASAAGWALVTVLLYAASAFVLDACGCRRWLRARLSQRVEVA